MQTARTHAQLVANTLFANSRIESYDTDCVELNIEFSEQLSAEHKETVMGYNNGDERLNNMLGEDETLVALALTVEGSKWDFVAFWEEVFAEFVNMSHYKVMLYTRAVNSSAIRKQLKKEHEFRDLGNGFVVIICEAPVK